MVQMWLGSRKKIKNKTTSNIEPLEAKEQACTQYIEIFFIYSIVSTDGVQSQHELHNTSPNHSDKVKPIKELGSFMQ